MRKNMKNLMGVIMKNSMIRRSGAVSIIIGCLAFGVASFSYAGCKEIRGAGKPYPMGYSEVASSCGTGLSGKKCDVGYMCKNLTDTKGNTGICCVK